MREVAFDPDQSQGVVTVRNSLADDADIKSINVLTKGKGRPPNLKTHAFKPAYTAPLCLTDRKLADVGTLCGSFVPPEEHHGFYKSLVDFQMIVRNPDLAIADELVVL